MAENFARRLEAIARRTPEKPALVWDGGALTFDEMDRRAGAFADILATKGVKPGDRIALAIGNRWAFAVGLLAGWKLGATVAPLDTLLKDDEPRVSIDDASLVAGRLRLRHGSTLPLVGFIRYRWSGLYATVRRNPAQVPVGADGSVERLLPA